jgi:predicted PurR-regulated permease PerM
MVLTLTRKKIGFLFFIIPVILLTLYFSKGVLTPFIFAFFLAYAINPLVEFFQKRGARREWAIMTVYFILFLVTALVVGIIIPRLIRDLTGLILKLPLILQDLKGLEGRFNEVYESWRLPFNIKMVIDGLVNRSGLVLRNSLVRMAQSMVNLFSQSLLLLILVPLMAYYISRDYPVIKQHTYQWVFNNFGARWTQVFIKIDSVFKQYIRGQLLDTLIVGALIGLGLSLLGFEAAFLLGLVAGLLNLIPYFGPPLSAIPSVIFALFQSPWLALYVILLFLIVNQIEVMFLTPKIIGCSLGLHPVTVIFLILIGGKIFGLLGMIFAVPLGAVCLIIIKSVYEICFESANREPLPES